jgi:uncharacterized protein
VTFQVIPRELAFYGLFERGARGAAEAAAELRALVDELGAPGPRVARIHELEQAGDELTHEIVALLNTTFVVPMDREDIYGLATHLDDVLDGIEATAQLVVLLRIEVANPDFRRQADVLAAATQAIVRSVTALRSPGFAARAVKEIVRLERDGDHLYRTATAALFAGDHKALDVLKWQDVLKAMESAIDRCEDVANDIEAIAVKQA